MGIIKHCNISALTNIKSNASLTTKYESSVTYNLMTKSGISILVSNDSRHLLWFGDSISEGDLIALDTEWPGVNILGRIVSI